METETIRVSGIVAAAPQKVFDAWLDSQEHSRFTGGGVATVEPGVGGRFTAWGGYIEGRTLELDPGRRIVQSWRSTDFPPGHPDSRLEVLLEPDGEQTRVTFVHSEIPAGQSGQYEEGWREHYLQPMTKYFGESAPDGESSDGSAFEDVAAATREMLSSAEDALGEAEAVVEEQVRKVARTAVQSARKAVEGVRKAVAKAGRKTSQNAKKTAKSVRAKATKAIKSRAGKASQAGRAMKAKAGKSAKKVGAKAKRAALKTVARVKQTVKKSAKKGKAAPPKKKTKSKK